MTIALGVFIVERIKVISIGHGQLVNDYAEDIRITTARERAPT